MLQSFNQVAPILSKNLGLGPEISVEVVFGTPSQNCIGSGICKVMSRSLKIQRLSCPHSPAWLSYNRGRLRFRFSKSEVKREDVKLRLETSLFLVNEPFQIPASTSLRLGLGSPWVSSGKYSMSESDQDWILTIPYPEQRKFQDS